MLHPPANEHKVDVFVQGGDLWFILSSPLSIVLKMTTPAVELPSFFFFCVPIPSVAIQPRVKTVRAARGPNGEETATGEEKTLQNTATGEESHCNYNSGKGTRTGKKKEGDIESRCLGEKSRRRLSMTAREEVSTFGHPLSPVLYHSP
jgi:hypothetical protein